MATSTGMGFDLDDVVTAASKADKILESMVKRSEELTKNMREAFNTGGSGGNMKQYTKQLTEIQKLLGEIGQGKLTVDVDNNKLKQANDAISNIVKTVNALTKGSAPVQLFDVAGLNAANKGIIVSEMKIEVLSSKMEELRKEWYNMFMGEFTPDMQRRLTRKNGTMFEETTPTYKKTVAKRRDEIEMEMRALVEKQAIAQKELKYEKMTQDEKAAYVKKVTDRILNEERAKITAIRKEYQSLWSQFSSVDAGVSKFEAATVGGKKLTSEEEGSYLILLDRRNEINKRLEEMYSQHQDVLSDIAEKKAIERSERIKNIEKRAYTPQEALSLARNPSSASEMKHAMGAIDSALSTVDKRDVGTIRRLKESYDFLSRDLDEILMSVKEKNAAIVKDQEAMLKKRDALISSVGKFDEAANAGKKLSQSELDERERLEKELDDVNKRIESNYKHYQTLLTETAEREAQKRADTMTKDLSRRAYTPQEALTLSSLSSTGAEMKEAQGAIKSALFNVDKSDLTTIKQLQNEYVRLKAEIEKLTKAQHEEQSLQPSLRNEYSRTLKEIDKLEQQKNKLYKAEIQENSLTGSAADHQAEYDAIDARLQDLYQRRVDMETQAGDLLEETFRRHEAEKTKIAIEEYQKRVNEMQAHEDKYGSVSSAEAQQVIADTEDADNVMQHKEAIEQLTKARNKLSESDADYQDTLDGLNEAIEGHVEAIEGVTDAEKAREKQEAKNATKDAQSALQYSKNAKTAAEMEKAIKYLDQARKKEDLTTKQGRQNHQRLTAELERQKRQYERMQAPLKKTADSMSKIAKLASTMFSLNAIKGFIDKLIQVRGEFELQQRSLEAILQNKDEADKLWNKTIQLAVKSPFTIQQLVAYTKQLAAYRIEAGKLYETNKMLADISAGLGVDMQRLILAYGQVKAANYLRGTELRQFSEAGVNILGELADTFTQLEGRVVSVGEVFERVSKRMVSFRDVDKVLKKLTSDGGIFYNMQEIQAETLRGQIMNLKDSVSVMLNEIGKSNDGVLKGSVQLVRELVNNWEIFANILKGVVPLIGIMSLNLLMSDRVLLKFATSMNLSVVGTTQFSKALGLAAAATRKFGAAMMRNMKFNLWAIAIAAVVGSVFELTSEYNNLTDAIEETNQSYEKQIFALNEIGRAYTRVIRKEKELAKENKKSADDDRRFFNERRLQVEKLLEYAKEKNITLSIEFDDLNVDEVTKEFTEKLDENFKQAFKDMQFATEWGHELAVAFTDALNAIEWWGILGDNLGSDFKDANEAIAGFEGATRTNILQALGGIEDIYDQLPEYYQKLFDKLNDKMRDGTEETKMELADIANALGQFRNLLMLDVGTTNLLNYLDAKSLHLYSTLSELESELDDIANKQLKKFGVSDFSELTEEQRVTMRMIIDKEFSNKELDDELKRWSARLLAERFKLPLELTTDQAENDLSAWQLRYNEIIAEMPQTRMLYPIEDVQKDRLALANELKGELENINKEIKEYEDEVPAVMQKKVLNYIKNEWETVELTSQEASDNIEQLRGHAERIDTVIKFLLGSDYENKDDKVSATLSNQIALIKKIADEYENLRRTKEAAFADDIVKKSYQEAAAELNILDIVNNMVLEIGDNLKGLGGDMKSGVVNALRTLQTQTPPKLQKVITKAIGDFEVQVGVNKDEENLSNIEKYLDQLFEVYELTRELESKNIPLELAEAFGFIPMSLEELEEVVTEFQNQLKGTKGFDIYRKNLERLAKEQGSLTKTMMDKYSKMMEDTVTKIANAQNKGALDINFAKKMFDEGKLSAEQFSMVVQNVTQKVASDVSKLKQEAFKGTPDYLRVMGDLSGYSYSQLEAMMGRIQKTLSDSSSDMQAEDLKVFQDALDKIANKMEEIKPFWNKGNLAEMRTLIQLQKEFEKEEGNFNHLLWVQTTQKQALVDAEKKLAYYRSLQKKYKETGEGSDQQSNIDAAKGELETVVGNLNKTNNELNTAQAKLNGISSKISAIGGQGSVALKTVEKIVTEIYNGLNAALDMFDSLKETAASFGQDTESGTWSDLSIAADSLGKVNERAMSGFNNLKSGNIVGAITDTVGGIAAIVQGFNALSDNQREKKIARELKLVEELEEAYAKLEKQISVANEINLYESKFDNMRKNLKTEIMSRERIIELEQDKKKTDKDRIKEQQQAIEELREQLKTLEEERIKSLGGIGGKSDINSATDAFVDAWLNAFRETGDGISGLEEQFDELFMNMVKRQMVMRVTEKILDPFYKQFDKMFAEGSIGDGKAMRQEIERVSDKFRNDTMPALDAVFRNFVETLGIADDIQKGAGSLSELQKGIQGVSETTAQALESLLNSIRLYVSSTNEYSREQLAYTKKLYNFFENIGTASHPLGGRGLKVVS